MGETVRDGELDVATAVDADHPENPVSVPTRSTESRRSLTGRRYRHRAGCQVARAPASPPRYAPKRPRASTGISGF
jgi:hypothetical protein